MSRPLSERTLHKENLAYAGTNGVSQANRRHRFLPAFRDEETGRVELARFANGLPAPTHLIEGLPLEWASAHAEDGSISALKACITAGFVRDEEFFTREQAAAFV